MATKKKLTAIEEPPEILQAQADQAVTPTKQRGDSDESVKRVQTLTEVFKKYRAGKEQLDTRIIENDRWYRSLHWDVLREKAGKTKNESDAEPTSAYLWNTIANRHGDLMDAYPQAVMSEREESDKDEADRLQKIVRVGLERNRFHKVYSDCGWYKTKAGTSAYGVFWDQSLEGGIGDFSIKKVDLLRLFWEPGVDNIQDSEYVFAVSLMPVDRVKKLYPEASHLIAEDAMSSDLKSYNQTDAIHYDGKTLVIDAYYKETLETGATELHMDKYCGAAMLDSSKWKGKPMYAHGRYPFVLDPMYPEEHSPCGFGVVDVLRSPQTYIDKLDAILTMNALVSGTQRYLVKGDSIPVDKLMDLSIKVIKCNGNVRLNEDYSVLETRPLPPGIINHRIQKIAELKEVSGMNDFNRGSAGSGVTAASAILALQEAGNKLARAAIAGTYQAFQDITYLIIELITEHYDIPRKYRITGEKGENDVSYIEYDNSKLKPQPLPGVPGLEGVEGVEQETRKPIFDIVVHAEKHSPYAQIAMNELAKEFFAAGFFDPERAPAAMTALEMMGFDSKDRLKVLIEKNYQTMLGVQSQGNEQQQLVEMLQKMNQMIVSLGGQDMLEGTDLAAGLPMGGQPGMQAGAQQPPIAG